MTRLLRKTIGLTLALLMALAPLHMARASLGMAQAGTGHAQVSGSTTHHDARYALSGHHRVAAVPADEAMDQGAGPAVSAGHECASCASCCAIMAVDPIATIPFVTAFQVAFEGHHYPSILSPSFRPPIRLPA